MIKNHAFQMLDDAKIHSLKYCRLDICDNINIAVYFVPLVCSDGGQPKPQAAPSVPAVHVGPQHRPPLQSLLSHSSLGAPAQSPATPSLHA